MIVICEHRIEAPELTCHICERSESTTLTSPERAMIGIHETSLAWFYIAPGHEFDETSQQLVRLALELIGPEAWAVIQAGAHNGEAFCAAAGLHVVAHYLNETSDPSGINVYLAQTAPAS